MGTVTSFKYFGAVVSDDGSKPEVLSRITQATAALTKLKPIWRDNNISHGSRVKLMRSLFISKFLYACESWTLTAELEKRTQAFEMRCYRRLLNISYKDHVTNEEVRRNIQEPSSFTFVIVNNILTRDLNMPRVINRFVLRLLKGHEMIVQAISVPEAMKGDKKVNKHFSR